MQTTTLHALSYEHSAIAHDLDEAGGVLDDATLEARFDANATAFPDKVEACAIMIRTFEARAKVYEDEAKAMTERRRVAENAAARLKKYVQDCLAIAGERKVQGRLFTVSVQANPVAVEVTCDANALPEAYRRTKVEVSADKTAIKAALQAGESIDGCALVQSESVRIR